MPELKRKFKIKKENIGMRGCNKRAWSFGLGFTSDLGEYYIFINLFTIAFYIGILYDEQEINDFLFKKGKFKE